MADLLTAAKLCDEVRFMPKYCSWKVGFILLPCFRCRKTVLTSLTFSFWQLHLPGLIGIATYLWVKLFSPWIKSYTTSLCRRGISEQSAAVVFLCKHWLFLWVCLWTRRAGCLPGQQQCCQLAISTVRQGANNLLLSGVVLLTHSEEQHISAQKEVLATLSVT